MGKKKDLLEKGTWFAMIFNPIQLSHTFRGAYAPLPC